ncbi:hypothetical protein ACWCPD_26120 [Streptomyces sp. NPDC001935]
MVLAVLTGLLMPRPASATGTSGESIVYTNLAGKGDGTRTPDIVSTSANNAVVVWREGLRPGNVDMGYMRYAYTTDGGTTWSRPQTLAQETDRYAWHYVILYRAGSTLYAYLGRTTIADSTEADGDGINNNGLPIEGTFLKRSTDQGHTWQDAPPSPCRTRPTSSCPVTRSSATTARTSCRTGRPGGRTAHLSPATCRPGRWAATSTGTR